MDVAELVNLNKDLYPGINSRSKLLDGTRIQLADPAVADLDADCSRKDTPRTVAARTRLPLDDLLAINAARFNGGLEADSRLERQAGGRVGSTLSAHSRGRRTRPSTASRCCCATARARSTCRPAAWSAPAATSRRRRSAHGRSPAARAASRRGCGCSTRTARSRRGSRSRSRRNLGCISAVSRLQLGYASATHRLLGLNLGLMSSLAL